MPSLTISYFERRESIFMILDQFMSDAAIGMNSLVEARKDLFCTSVADDLVIFDAEKGTYYGSGLVGQQIWGIISEPKSVDAVCDALLEKFDVDRRVCEKQVLEFLSDLHGRGLIHVN